jgi:uncharacterized membrane protein YbaN (DUF454 family)
VLFVTLGVVLLGVGFAGAVLPLVPTTFPLLLAAGLFARSSSRLERWLLGHRVFGAYLRNYKQGLGMTRRHKATTLVTLWVGIGISMYLSHTSVVALIVLAIVLVGVTTHIALLPTAARSHSESGPGVEQLTPARRIDNQQSSPTISRQEDKYE